MWGFGLRRYKDDVENSPLVVFQPPDRTLKRDHVFVQDEVALRADLDLTLGAKLEANSYTGTELLPSARLAWRPSDTHLVWTAVSRAVRAPSRVDRELFSPGVLAGGPNFVSEVSQVLELGYRGQPTRTLSYSVTGFYNRLEHLRTLTPAPGGAVVSNDREGHTRGIEAWGTWRAADWWRLNAGIMRQHQALRLRPGAVDVIAPGSEGNDPGGWYKLRASFDLSPQHELDLMLRHYDLRPAPNVPAYTTLDGRFGWRLAADMELSVVVQNLLDRRHPEWGTAVNRIELERAAFIKLKITGL
jgi:iron complex outermembrane receptor protein